MDTLLECQESAPSPKPTMEPADQILVKMTLEQMASLMAGADDWHIRGLPEHGVPAMLVADCGHGVTLCGERSSPATCFPTGIGLASTWNNELMEEVGAVIGRECLALGVSILLGPKLNLHRIPLHGRSFETFSEDPLLAGQLGGAIIRGIQREGVGACVKALTGNNQQKDQHTTSSEIDEETLRELYLRVFEIAIAEGRPCSAMTSYNLLNGENTAESKFLINGVIKGDWNFDGFIVSDWRAVRSEAVYGAGLDLEMPGPGKFYDTASVLQAVEEGRLSTSDVTDSARRILRVALQYGRAEEERGKFSQYLNSPENRRIACEAAEESLILLKNEGAILPMDKYAIRRLAVIGPNAAAARLGGGGSASVTPFESVSPVEAIRRICGPEVEVVHEEGCGLVGSLSAIHDVLEHRDEEGAWHPGLLAEFFNQGEVAGQPDAAWAVPHADFSWGWAAPGPGVTRYEFAVRFSGRIVPRTTGKHSIGVYAQEGCVRLKIDGQSVVDEWTPVAAENDFEGNYATRYRTIELNLTAGQPVAVVLEYGKRAARAAIRLEWSEPGAADLMARALNAAAKADAVVICCGLSNLFEGGNVDRSTLHLPEAQEQLIRRVAKVNPRTIVALNNGGPLVLPWEPEVPAIIESWYPGQDGGTALARILFGEVNPSGRLPDTIAYHFGDHASAKHYPGKNGKAHYAERLFIGYRHFDKVGIKPHYPFGFGLSYTTYEISEPALEKTTIRTDEQLHFSVQVRNTGTRAGKETVQIYFGNVEVGEDEPERILAAFRKFYLEPGEQQEIWFALGPQALGFWDHTISQRCLVPGTYVIQAGSHSRSLEEVRFEIIPA